MSQSPYNSQQVVGLSAQGSLLIRFVKIVLAVFSLRIGKSKITRELMYKR